MAESRGKIAHDFRVFFMGHKGSMEAKYTTNKGMLPVELIEEMKQAFRRSEEFLDLEIRTDPKEKTQQQNEMENSQHQQATQMVVSIDQVEGLICKGWRLVTVLPREKQSAPTVVAESERCEPTDEAGLVGFEPTT